MRKFLSLSQESCNFCHEAGGLALLFVEVDDHVAISGFLLHRLLPWLQRKAKAESAEGPNVRLLSSLSLAEATGRNEVFTFTRSINDKKHMIVTPIS